MREKIDPAREPIPDALASLKLREEAARDLVNIDGAERQRRLLAGSVGLAATAALGFLCATQPWYVRYFAVSPLLGLSLGFLVSGQQGL